MNRSSHEFSTDEGDRETFECMPKNEEVREEKALIGRGKWDGEGRRCEDCEEREESAEREGEGDEREREVDK
jgi:hypothetical protein